ncbi:hypothetical protein CVT24_004167 [Panaeolus cyanescens]|uniref:DUF6533 domain-containing protein n=1 Tax=Panaeolus cyanescens TaxID=181874 RepID=A0A409YX58_9AGAR|nr:hypothetical protein CVT24_004167 [Panaeolus cyanescens]
MSAPAGPPDMAAITAAIVHLNAGKYFQIAAFVMLIYDHMLTFSDEVERIWKQKISGATILFLLNRYLTPLQFIVIINAFQDPSWTKEVCDRFVVFEGASTAALVGICELIMILRVYALYGQSKAVLAFLMLLWVVQISVSAAGLHTGFAVPLPDFLVGCILTGNSLLMPAVWVTPLITDSCIFILTVWRTRQYLTRSGKTPIMHIFLRDGAMYFFVIFLANLLNTVFYFTAVDDLKAIGASFSQLITATMISRLVLNLRSISDTKNVHSTYPSTLAPLRGVKTPEDTFVGRTLGSLGAELVDPGTEDRDEKFAMEDVTTRSTWQ